MKILFIEDDNNFSHVLSLQLEKEGFVTDICDDGADILDYLEQNTYDIILLDRMLPHMDGITALREIRKKGILTPVIILTALGEIDDRVTGLDAGADDYLVKPFEFKELMARIRSINRRPREWKNINKLCFGDISFEPDSNLLTGELGSCTLSKKESALLEFFLHNPKQILARGSILSNVWGSYVEVEDGNLDNYIYFLRRRLGSVSKNVSIQTKRGVGYFLKEEN